MLRRPTTVEAVVSQRLSCRPVRRGPAQPLRAGLLLIALLPMLACGSALRRSSSAVTLEVENRNWADMTVSVSRGGAAVRLGTVTTNTTRRFRLPRDLSYAGVNVFFVADPVGATDTFRSVDVGLMGGETYRWTLMSPLSLSTLVLR